MRAKGSEERAKALDFPTAEPIDEALALLSKTGAERQSPVSAWVRPVGPPQAAGDRTWNVLRWLIVAGIAWGIWRASRHGSG
jgi:hypothetical protein